LIAVGLLSPWVRAAADELIPPTYADVRYGPHERNGLAYVAYALPTLTREQRADMAKVEISSHFNAKQEAFLDFVLAHYVSEGVRELDQEKLTPLLHLKYNNSISDAIADLGRPEDIGQVFAGFQQYLYQVVA